MENFKLKFLLRYCLLSVTNCTLKSYCFFFFFELTFFLFLLGVLKVICWFSDGFLFSQSHEFNKTALYFHDQKCFDGITKAILKNTDFLIAANLTCLRSIKCSLSFINIKMYISKTGSLDVSKQALCFNSRK